MDQSALQQKMRTNFDAVEQRITAACARAGRQRSEVTLVAVTKTIPVELAALVPGLGILDLGENRPQQLWSKAARFPSVTRWHLIGHLQRNKIEKSLPWVRLIPSVDSRRLLQALEQATLQEQQPLEVLLEINASGEARKQGFEPEAVMELLSIMQELKRVQVRGLMTMAAMQEPEACRTTFRRLRNLRDQLQPQLPPQHLMQELSMGMSNDFEVAIEEGATLIRLGTVLFEDLLT